jgi:hypothetical protein
MNREAFRFSRPIVTSPGWSVLDLPDDVLDHTSPDLADLRILSANGELAYEPEKQLTPVSLRLPLSNVERARSKETTALVDRGNLPEPCSQLTLEVAGSEAFLKPVILEASDDRSAYREVARGSLFRVEGGVMTTLSFPANTRRYLRIRLDDRESDPVTPNAAVLERPAPTPVERSVPVTLTPLATSSTSEDTYSVSLPSQHLRLVSLHLGTTEPVFSRTVHVYERVLFRDHPTRRSISVGQIARGPNGKENLELPLAAISESNFEIDVERVGTPLTITAASVHVLPERIVFLAPKAGDLELVYGVAHADAPRYDLAAAMALGRPEHLEAATLGPARDRGAAPTPTPAPIAPSRGGVLDSTQWLRRAPITLPVEGTVAYLDLGAEAERGLRIVDHDNRQVPYVTESGSQHEHRSVPLAVRTDASRTVASLSRLNLLEKLDGVQLHAKSPPYFSRAVSAYEAVSDARAVTGRRALGSGIWERQPSDGDVPFNLELDNPTQQTITIEVENGDNPPLELSAASLEIVRRRIDFVFAPSDRLTLLYDNPNVGEPSYDLRLLSPTLVATPARAARLGPSEDRTPPADSQHSRWLVVAVVVSAALVLLALMRTLRSETTPEKRDDG